MAGNQDLCLVAVDQGEFIKTNLDTIHIIHGLIRQRKQTDRHLKTLINELMTHA